MFMFMHMTTKTITIKEEIYNLLLSIKRKNESFSDLFERLVKRNDAIDILEKIKGTIDFGNTEELFREIKEKRANWR